MIKKNKIEIFVYRLIQILKRYNFIIKISIDKISKKNFSIKVELDCENLAKIKDHEVILDLSADIKALGFLNGFTLNNVTTDDNSSETQQNIIYTLIETPDEEEVKKLVIKI